MDEFYELDKNPQYDVDAIRKKKKRLKKKRRRRRIKFFLFLILITGIIVGVCLTPMFKIVSINVEDTPHYTGEEIKSYVLSLEGTNGFRDVIENYKDFDRASRLRLGALEDKLYSVFIYANDIKIAFVPPARLNVMLTEREPFAVVRTEDKMILIDKTGYVLEEIAENTNNYIQINGVENVKTKPGEYFCDKPKEAMDIANKVLNAFSELDKNDENNKLIPKIIAINISDTRKVQLYVDSRIKVILGDVRNDDILMYRANYLKQLVFKFVGNKDRGTIDFTMGEDPRFIPSKAE